MRHPCRPFAAKIATATSLYADLPRRRRVGGKLMNETIDLIRSKDPTFQQEVEAESGQNISNCYQCGNCTAGCPAALDYDMMPNQVMRGIQLGLRDKVLGSQAIYMCLSCSTCSLRCPNSIDIAGVMETLRHMARRTNKVGVKRVEKFWLSFLDTVRAFGRSYEIGTMALYMLRSLRFWTDVDLAPKALMKQKLGLKPHVIPSKESVEAVGRIFKRYQERAKREGVRP
jgi:heterodisulfide reductase subunit C